MREVNEKAPILASSDITIEAKPEKAWAVLTDIDHWDEWLKMVSKSKLNGELMENTTFDWKAGGANIHSVLHAVEPYQYIGWTGKAMSLSVVHNWSLLEKKGITTVHVGESMNGLIAKLFKKKLGRSLQKDMDLSLKYLKQECEQVVDDRQ